MKLKAFQIKYRGVHNNREHITGSRNNGPAKVRTRRWNGPRHKLVTGIGKRLARLSFDKGVKNALS